MTSFAFSLGLVFLAELGDKTQLIALTMGPGRRPVPTLAGLAVTIGLLQGLAVAVGGTIGAALPDTVVGIGSGLLFLGFAVWAWRSAAAGDAEVEPPPVSLGAFLVAFFLAELGDKSNLATAALATAHGLLPVWLGATLGLLAATALALAGGTWLQRRVSTRTLRRVGAAAFLVAGVITLVTTVW